MPPSQIRVATIGTWGHYSHVLLELATMPQVRLVGHARSFSDDSPDQMYRITGNQQIPWYEDYHQMLRDIRPDVVIISTRIDRINPIAIDVAEAGCHLICEKPLAMDHSKLNQLYSACIARKVHCISMLGNGRHPAMLAAAGILQAGQLGKVVLANARKSYKWGSRPEWFAHREFYGDTIGWVAIHALDMIHALTSQEFTSVAAMQSNQAHPDRPDCQDNGIILLGLSGGGHASVSFDYLRPSTASTHGDTWIRIVGSRGIVEANLDHNWCRLTPEGSPERELPLPPEGPYYRTFIEGLSQNADYPPPHMRQAFMLTHVGLCASDAADQKKIVEIPRGPWA